MAHGILIVEDEVILAKNINRYLERQGYEVRSAADVGEGLRQFEAFKPDVVLLDYNLPGGNGIELLERIRSIDSQVKVIMITAHGNVRVAVDAMKAGAYDYLSKPLALGELKLLVDKAVGQERLEGTLSYYRSREAGGSGLDKIMGSSPAMLQLKQRIAQLLDAERRIAEGAAPPVLITGETGTGKELVARALHFDGTRRNQPFVEINCSAIPAHLIESELFGYERGAFTDARERKIGLIESAHGGTLFLDEIGDIDPAVQVKLLKLLEDKLVRRLGSVRDNKVDIRIMAATNRSLETLVREGKFRSDLYFRLRVVTVEPPPLRDRGEDIVILAEHFLSEHGRRYGRPTMQLSSSAREALLRHDWPGNVRELRNLMEQVVLLSDSDMVDSSQLPFDGADAAEADAPRQRDPAVAGHETPTAGAHGNKTLEDVERDLIARALDRSSGNVTMAARSLGISRDTLRYRMKRHGLQAVG